MWEQKLCNNKCWLDQGTDILFVLTDHAQPYYAYTHIPIAIALVQTPLTRSFLKLIHSHSQRSLELALGGLSVPLPELHPSTPSIQSKHSNPELLFQIKPGLSLFFSISLCIFFLFYLYSGTFQRILVMIRSNKSKDCYVLYILLVLRGDLSDEGPRGPPQGGDKSPAADLPYRVCSSRH